MGWCITSPSAAEEYDRLFSLDRSFRDRCFNWQFLWVFTMLPKFAVSDLDSFEMLLCIEPLDWVALETIGMPEFASALNAFRIAIFEGGLGASPSVLQW